MHVRMDGLYRMDGVFFSTLASLTADLHRNPTAIQLAVLAGYLIYIPRTDCLTNRCFPLVPIFRRAPIRIVMSWDGLDAFEQSHFDEL